MPYQQSLFRYITDPVAQGGLGGAVRAVDYPVGEEGRITIQRAVP